MWSPVGLATKKQKLFTSATGWTKQTNFSKTPSVITGYADMQAQLALCLSKPPSKRIFTLVNGVWRLSPLP